MAKKFSARYTDNDELSRMITMMKLARRSTGYSQQQFGKLIGISRETVVHIEGLVECSVLSLECEVLKRWYSLCANKISEYERETLQNAINEYLFCPAFALNSPDSSMNFPVNNSNSASRSSSNTKQQKAN